MQCVDWRIDRNCVGGRCDSSVYRWRDGRPAGRTSTREWRDVHLSGYWPSHLRLDLVNGQSLQLTQRRNEDTLSSAKRQQCCVVRYCRIRCAVSRRNSAALHSRELARPWPILKGLATDFTIYLVASFPRWFSLIIIQHNLMPPVHK